MGLAIEGDRFDEADYPRFLERLEQSLRVLGELIARPGFGQGPASLGAELELSLVDASGAPLPSNREVLAETTDPRLTVELDRFNLECNLRPTPLRGRPFAALADEIDAAVAELERAAARHGGRVACIGILPNLRPEDLSAAAMTDSPRYRALSRALQRLRSEPYHLRIRGEETLDIRCEEITFEGAATSLQIHLRVAPKDFSDLYNAVQLATAPALAVAANSPSFLGRRLWAETRIALFKQAVDARAQRGSKRDGEARVSFGSGWLREGALELFAENVALHEPLLPVLGDEDPLACLRAGGVPRLDEMRLHQGTVWRWNRAIYDPVAGGHLRIEMRSLPAGPTTPDMAANTAFLVGLALGMASDAPRWSADHAFELAHRSFYRAAQEGLAAQLDWPSAQGGSERLPVRELIPRLLPVARAGLAAAGVEAEDSEPLLALIGERVRRGQNGAAWQRRQVGLLEAALGRSAATTAMLERYLALAGTGSPVHCWPLES